MSFPRTLSAGDPYAVLSSTPGNAKPIFRTLSKLIVLPCLFEVLICFDDRAELLAAAPDFYYVTDHYLGYSAVLARLSRVTPDVLRDLLGMAHKFVNARKERRSPSRHRRKPV